MIREIVGTFGGIGVVVLGGCVLITYAYLAGRVVVKSTGESWADFDPGERYGACFCGLVVSILFGLLAWISILAGHEIANLLGVL